MMREVGRRFRVALQSLARVSHAYFHKRMRSVTHDGRKSSAMPHLKSKLGFGLGRAAERASAAGHATTHHIYPTRQAASLKDILYRIVDR